MTQPAGGAGRPLWVPALYPIVIALVYLSLLFLGIGVSIHSALRVFIAFALGAALIGVVANLVMRDRHRGGHMPSRPSTPPGHNRGRRLCC